MEYNNLLDIYDKLVDISNQKHAEFDFNVVGFDEALFILHYALKHYVPINLHIDNRNLQRQLSTCISKQSEYTAGKLSIIQTNRELKAENSKLKSENDRLRNMPEIHKAIKQKAGFNRVEIDFEGQDISFLINTNTETFNQHFNDASNYIFSKRKKRVHLSTIKCWYLEWYRALGFTCVPT